MYYYNLLGNKRAWINLDYKCCYNNWCDHATWTQIYWRATDKGKHRVEQEMVLTLWFSIRLSSGAVAREERYQGGDMTWRDMTWRPTGHGAKTTDKGTVKSTVQNTSKPRSRNFDQTLWGDRAVNKSEPSQPICKVPALIIKVILLTVKYLQYFEEVGTARSTVLATGQHLKVGTRKESDVTVRGQDSGKLS